MTGEKDRVPATRGWLRDNPYLLLALAALFWSGNHIVGRAIGGEVPKSADGSSNTLLLTPGQHGTDGFFVAVMQKVV